MGTNLSRWWLIVNERKVLREISNTLHEGKDLSSMLQIVLEKMLEVTGFHTGWVFLTEGVEHRLIAHYGLPEGLSYGSYLPMCKDDCWCLDRCVSGRLQRAVNIIECQRIDRVIENQWGNTSEITHHATIPIRAGVETYGLINVASPKKTHFTEEELELLEIIALQVGATVSRIKLYEREQKRAQYLQLFSEWMQRMNELTENNTLIHSGIESLYEIFPWDRIELRFNDRHVEFGVSKPSFFSFEEEIGRTKASLTIFGECLEEIDKMLAKQVCYHFALIGEKNRVEQQRTELALLEERNRLARDLHDSVNQLLFSITLISKGVQARTKDEKISEPLVEIQTLSNEALQEMRKLIWQLRPEGLEQGVITAIKRYSDLIKVKADIHLSGILDLDKAVEECLWRVAQEALNNVKKHSQSNHVQIWFHVKDDVSMMIKDTGCGFDSKGVGHTTTFGLKTMQERVNKLGGTITIDSKKNKGTTIAVRLPV